VCLEPVRKPGLTRERFVPGETRGMLTFGTVILTRRDSGIRAFADLKGKRLAAVSPDAFGGFQIAWDELRRQSIGPFVDLKSIQFLGFPQDEIVQAVAAGDVRSGLLESLQAEGRIRLADFAILNRNSQPGYPFLVTGHLYPEWPFLALPWIDKSLQENVTLALIKTQGRGVKQEFGLQDLWSAPLSYEGVRKLVARFKIPNRRFVKRSGRVYRHRNFFGVCPGCHAERDKWLAHFSHATPGRLARISRIRLGKVSAKPGDE
jgi:two-component system, LuxR family, sensor histidine kinase TtrS